MLSPTAMGSWTDEVEEAPTERPEGFAMPRTAPLPHVEAAASPAAGKPAVAPGSFSAPAAPPLEVLVPRTGPTRDAGRPFDVAASVGFGGSHGAFDPLAPMQTTSAEPLAPAVPSAQLPSPHPLGLQPAVAGWTPEADAVPARPARTASLPQLVALVGTPLLALLAVGTLVWQLAFPMLVVCLVLVALRPHHPLAGRLRPVMGGAAAAALALAFVWNVMEDSLFSLGRFSQLGCLGVLCYAAWLAWRDTQQS